MWLLILIAYTTFTLGVVISASSVYMPRNPRTGKDILIYFEDVAAIDYHWFLQRARLVGVADIEEQLLDQIHRVSVVVSSKMQRVRMAIKLSLLAVVLWVALLVYGSL